MGTGRLRGRVHSGIVAADSFSKVTTWFSGNALFDHRVQILDPDSKEAAESRHSTLPARRGEMRVATDAFNSIAFPTVGVYTAVVFHGGVITLK